MGIQVTLFDYYTYADIQNVNQPFSPVENAQDIVNVNLNTNIGYLYTTAIFSITSFRIRTEYDTSTVIGNTDKNIGIRASSLSKSANGLVTRVTINQITGT